jgi:hypothetical protein
VTAGAEYERQRVRQTSVATSSFGVFRDALDTARHTTAYFVDALRRVGPRVTLSGGARLEDNSWFGRVVTWRAGASWRVGAATLGHHELPDALADIQRVARTHRQDRPGAVEQGNLRPRAGQRCHGHRHDGAGRQTQAVEIRRRAGAIRRTQDCRTLSTVAHGHEMTIQSLGPGEIVIAAGTQRFVFQRGVQLGLIDPPQHQDGVVSAALPQLRIQATEQTSSGAVPRPIEVVRQIPQPLQSERERGYHDKRPNRFHVGSPDARRLMANRGPLCGK